MRFVSGLLAGALALLILDAALPRDARAARRAAASRPATHRAATSQNAAFDVTGAAGDSTDRESGSGADTKPAATDSDSDSDLGPTTAEPWCPPRPVAGAEPWEVALRFPFRVATFAISGLGYVTKHTLIYVEETSLVPRVQMALEVLPRTGLYVSPAGLGDRTGLGGAVRIRPNFLGRMVSAEVQGSTKKYSRFRFGVGRGPAEIAYANEWRPRDRFFGIGPNSSDEEPSSYSYRTHRVLASLAYPWAESESTPRFHVGAWAGPREIVLRRGREAPSFDDRFPAFGALLDRRQEHFVYGGRLSYDGRSGTPHWSRGARLVAQAERFDRAIEALAIRDGHTVAPQFTRLSALGEVGVSFMRDPRTVRLAVNVVNQRLGAGSAPLLIPDLMTLGGHSGLAGFEPGRFHDQDLVAGKLTYIFPLTRNFEFELHAETGNVFPKVEDARLTAFRNSYGIALRPRTDLAPLGSLGLDWSSETVRFRFSFGGVE